MTGMLDSASAAPVSAAIIIQGDSKDWASYDNTLVCQSLLYSVKQISCGNNHSTSVSMNYSWIYLTLVCDRVVYLTFSICSFHLLCRHIFHTGLVFNSFLFTATLYLCVEYWQLTTLILDTTLQQTLPFIFTQKYNIKKNISKNIC